MIKKLLILSFSLPFCLNVSSQQFQRGPYTVKTLAEGVYDIEDSNDSNPAGNHIDKYGKITGLNNCSDMYLVNGKGKTLLIDLSNAVKWDTTAARSLRSIVFELAGENDLYITITHKHGDHYGMLPAFYNDTRVHFLIPAKEFEGTDLFPSVRTVFFKENESLDLGGGTIINTMEVPGHTEHSTIYFLKGRNIVFTGDAIGSGSGVWLFSYNSFVAYTRSIDKLIKYIEYPSNHIDRNNLIIYGGHGWQRGKLEKISAQYIYDMRSLLGKIGEGKAETEPLSVQIKYLDTNFKYGTATISWNREDAAKYAGTYVKK